MTPTELRAKGRTAAVAVCLAFGLGACTSAPASTSSDAAPRSPAATPWPAARYVELADAVHAHGAEVWIEADLVKAWQAGTERYQHVLDVVAAFAARPGVRGVKIADELGYGDGMDPAQALAFLKQTTAALHAKVPGTKVLVDVVIPEFGCLAWQRTSATRPTTDATGTGGGLSGIPTKSASAVLASERTCAATARAKDPGASIASVDAEISQGGLDVVDLSAGLQEDQQYAAWGTTRDTAMTAIWDEASRRWGTKVTLQARKALAHPGRYPGDAATAEADVHTFVDIPLAHGASAVDVWTWSQPYKDATYQLTDPGLGNNPLITALRARRAKGAHLWTHMTPSSLQRGLEPDVAEATTIFDAILVASGTG